MASRSRAVRRGGDEVVGGGVEVVEHVLLVLAPPGLVPRLAFLVAAPQAGDREQAAGLGPRGDRRRPGRRLGDGEAAVAGEDARRVGVGQRRRRGARGTGRSRCRPATGTSRASPRTRVSNADVTVGTHRAARGRRPAVPAEQAGGPGEALELQERQRFVRACRRAPTTRAQLGSATSPGSRRRPRVVMGQPGHGAHRAHDEHAVGHRLGVLHDAVALRHERSSSRRGSRRRRAGWPRPARGAASSVVTASRRVTVEPGLRHRLGAADRACARSPVAASWRCRSVA